MGSHFQPLRLGDVDPPGGFSPFEEERAFLQKRLALLGKVGVLVTLPYLILRTVSLVLSDSGSPLQAGLQIGGKATLANMASAGLVWLVCSRRPLRIALLKIIDAYVVFFFAVVVGVVSWHYQADPFPIAAQGTMLTFAVLVRAVIVPSTALRTAWISFPAYLPLLLAAYVAWASSGTAAVWGFGSGRLVLFVIRGLMGATLAAITSRIIFGLRREVRKARRLGQYVLEEKIGEGGMGEIYRASHAMLRRPTAVKLLHPELVGEQNLLRFQKEVQLTSQLTHPNTIAIYDYGRTPDGIFYYAMELLGGMNLQELVDGHGPLAPERVIHVLRQVCGSLAEAHAAGLIHRDIKPANIILCERGGTHDVAKLVDFGVVKQVEGAFEETAANVLLGTPYYMSPESIREPTSVDARFDVYAVGAVGYYLLTATRLFAGDSLQEILGHQLMTQPERPSERLRSPLPTDIEELILQCLEKDPEERPQTAQELDESLSSCKDSGRWTQEAATEWWADLEPMKQVEPAATNLVFDPTRTQRTKPVGEAPGLAGVFHRIFR